MPRFLPWLAACVAAVSALPAVADPATTSATAHFASLDAELHKSDDLDHIWITLDGYVELPNSPAAPDNDLLQRLRDGFALPTVSNRRVEAELNWYLKHPDYLNRVFERGQRYLPYITEQIETRGLPLELALLPIVESAYDPFAYSHGRAAGLWQIIPGTGRRFGIRQNWWYDGRRDIVDSTNGALDYLAYLHGLTDGDWMNAIASYNSGEGNVLKAMKNNRAKSAPTDFWNLKLSRETSSYVPKLLALVEIVRDPAAYGITLPSIVNEPQFVMAEIGGQLDLALAAELAGADLDDIYAYNPGFNRWATDPAGPHRLVIPVAYADDFISALSDVPASERLRWQRHKVKQGETLSEIAEKYHTTLASIRASNDLRGNTIRAGAYLMIPMASKPLSDYGQTARARQVKTQEKQRAGSRSVHIVAKGDSFWSIGQKYSVGTRELAGWNGMAPRDTLSIGQKLVVWSGKSVPAATVTSSKTTRKLNYTVRNGDSLYLIANRFRVTVNDLVKWNNIDKERILRPGQTLTMYVDVTSQSS